MRAWRAAALIGLAGCGNGTVADECAYRLAPGDGQGELQTALIDAPAGSVVCLAEGTYTLQTELSIAHDGVTLRGAGRDKTVLDFSAQDLGANGVQVSAHGVTIQGLTVRDTPGDGIRATSVRDVAFLDVAVRWTAEASLDNGAYGLYPVGCDGVRIERSLVQGARDAGIYVGQSTRILVADSEAFGNVAGIEIENSTDAEVRGNYAHDNTGGILVFNLPDLPVQDGKRAKIHHNRVENNNLPNFAEAGTVVAVVPKGSGVLVLASDDNEIHDNEIRKNDTLGLLLLSYVEAVFGPTSDAAFDPYPQRNHVHDNTFADNGAKPSGSVAAVIPKEYRPVPDILWDGCLPAGASPESDVNCLSQNGGAGYLDFDFCSSSPMYSQDTAPVTCTYPSLPEQSP